MVRVIGDIWPAESGSSSLGVDQTACCPVGEEIRPFNQIHQNSGVFHDPLYGQSGVIRLSQSAGAFEVSIDGGLTFEPLITALDGSGVHDINGATGPLIVLDGANGANVLTDGDTLTVDVSSLSGTIPIPMSGVALSRGEDFTEQTSVTFSHGIGGENLIVQVQDSLGDVVIPDTINVLNPNSVDVTFNRPRSGRIVAIGSSSGVSVIPAEERAGLKQGINPYSIGGSGISIPVGKIHYVDINNTHRVLKLSSEVLIDESAGLTANNWAYIYVHASGTSDNIGSGNFDYTATEPAFDGTKLGWYDTSPGSARRCVGAINSRSLALWRDSRSQGDVHQYSDSFSSIISNDSAYETQDVQLVLPVFSDTALLYLSVELSSVGGTEVFTWRPAGFSTETNGFTVAKITSPGGNPIFPVVQNVATHFQAIANSETKIGHLSVLTGGVATVAALRQYGYIIPTYIGNTPG